MRRSIQCVAGLAVAVIAALCWAGVGAISARGGDAPASAGGPTIDFVRDIRPIFEANCYKCHDAAKHKGGLRLDSKQTAYIGGDSGDPSLVPHEPDHSKIIQLVRGDDPNSVMPPKGKRLTSRQVDLLTRWVRQGAAWPDGIDKPGQALTHWSFSKPIRPALPKVNRPDWCRNPIDYFILHKLEQAGLSPAPRADRYTLCRRVYLDLIGIPPTPAEVDGFVSDTSPGAYERLVDRLMANPHYGERWARMWLDCARYADSAGYGSDPLRKTCFRYRDWVIEAFNRDLPYDEFTIEQLAGDLLPHPTTDQLIATEFNRNTMTNTEGGTDPEEFRVAAVKDRIETSVQVWMGLTMGCAQCHTHKYDPITNREYYQLFAIFNQTEDANRGDEAPTIETPTPEQAEQIAQLRSRLDAAEAKLKDPSQWTDAQREWERSLHQNQPRWTLLDLASFKSQGGATLTKQPDGSLLASGKHPATDTYTITARTNLRGITAFKLETLPDPSLPHKGSGRHENGGFVLNQFRVAVAPQASAPPMGRFVRIELPGRGELLHLAEVQVFHESENLALKGHATQSSTDFGGDAKFAIDGITNGDFAKHPTTHTAKSDNPWWEVDLGSEQPLDRIVVWNRTDSGLVDRLSDFRVVVLDARHKPIWETRVGPAPKPSLSIDLTAPREIALRDASDDFHTADGSASKTITGKAVPTIGWSIYPQVRRSHAAVFETAMPAAVNDGAAVAAPMVPTPARSRAVAQSARFPRRTGGGGGSEHHRDRDLVRKNASGPDSNRGSNSSPGTPGEGRVGVRDGTADVVAAPIDGTTTLTFTLTQTFPQASIGRLRLWATTSPAPVRQLPGDVSAALEIFPRNRSAAEKAAVFGYFLAVAPQAKREREEIASLQKQMEAIHPARTAIMRELPPDKRRITHALIKGNFLNKGPVVQPAVLAAFNPLPKGAPANRLGFARWLIDRENPLTARVAVNRFWGQIFGTGIVETQEDFGTQGQPPSDQALLDWLAVEFMEPTTPGARPWDMKRLVKLIVMSAAYQQASRVTPDELAKDPHNRLISRGPRHRLAAEAVRDQALALSGLLSKKMYGPSVFPPQPDGLWQAAFNGERTYPTSTGEDRYRRGIYVFWRRTVPYPSMSAFDAPSREICTLRRVQTSTPLQAFVTLNDPVYVECSQALARRIVREGGATPEQRATFALRLCLCHPPAAAQVQRVVELYNRELEHYRADAKAAKKITSNSALPSEAISHDDELAAWTVCANVLLNLDGVLTNN